MIVCQATGTIDWPTADTLNRVPAAVGTWLLIWSCFGAPLAVRWQHKLKTDPFVLTIVYSYHVGCWSQSHRTQHLVRQGLKKRTVQDMEAVGGH